MYYIIEYNFINILNIIFYNLLYSTLYRSKITINKILTQKIRYFIGKIKEYQMYLSLNTNNHNQKINIINY
jgi:hypothetical protein